MARVSVPTGDYQLYVSGDDKEAFRPAVKVASDATVKAELVAKKRWWE